MVVCKFFQQGNCRYGQNCRFEHIYSSKYSYNAAAQPQQDFGGVQVKDEQLVNQVHADVQSALRGGQWLLSCYAPFKEKAIFPGMSDLSPEEARLFIYEAKANNNLEQAVSYMNNVFSEAKHKYEMLLQKNQNIVSIFRSLYKEEPVSSPFGNLSALPGSAATSIFRGAVETNSVLSQNNATPSIFAQNNFSAPANDPAKSIFAQATQNVFSNNQSSIFSSQNQATPQQNIFQQQSVFSSPTDNAKSIFAQATQNSFTSPPQTNVFAQNNSSNVFAQNTQNAFAQSPPANPANVFASASQSIFSQNVPQNNQSSPFSQNTLQNRPENDGVYSKIDELSSDDIEAFKSDDFKMGFVPELPPPHSLCF